jgi:hypothetical protein
METIDLYNKATSAESLDDFNAFWFNIFKSRQTYDPSQLQDFLKNNTTGLSMIVTIIAAEVAFLSQSHLNKDEVLEYLIAMKNRMEVCAKQNMSSIINPALVSSFIENIFKKDKGLCRNYAFSNKGDLSNIARKVEGL